MFRTTKNHQNDDSFYQKLKDLKIKDDVNPVTNKTEGSVSETSFSMKEDYLINRDFLNMLDSPNVIIF